MSYFKKTFIKYLNLKSELATLDQRLNDAIELKNSIVEGSDITIDQASTIAAIQYYKEQKVIVQMRINTCTSDIIKAFEEIGLKVWIPFTDDQDIQHKITVNEAGNIELQ